MAWPLRRGYNTRFGVTHPECSRIFTERSHDLDRLAPDHRARLEFLEVPRFAGLNPRAKE